MNTKQNLVFFIGLTLIIMVFYINGYWTILKNGIFTNGASDISPPGAKKNIAIGPSGKCPAGYTKVGNQCVWYENRL
jgi:hypothetical protein